MIISAPNLPGLHITGVAIVLSMISGMPALWAMVASASISETIPSGFDRLSAKRAVTCEFSTARSTAPKS